MTDGWETARRLMALALHEDTPEHERVAAALAFVKVVERLGLLGSADVARPAAVDRPADWRPEDVRVRARDVLMGEGGLVCLGEARPCRACVMRQYPSRVRTRRASVIRSGEPAKKYGNGNYAHIDCAAEYEQILKKGGQ